MGMFRMAKRAMVVGSVLLATAYAGDGLNLYQGIRGMLTSPPAVEAGYVQPTLASIVAEKNGNGAVQTYLRYGKKENAVMVPLREGAYGPQLGEAAYIWENASAFERQQLQGKVWESLDTAQKEAYAQQTLEGVTAGSVERLLSQEQRESIFALQWYGLTDGTKAELIMEAWPAMDGAHRRTLVRKELDTLLGGE